MKKINLHSSIRKYHKAQNAQSKYEQAITELDIEIKKSLGEEYWISDVAGEGLVIKTNNDDLLVASAGTVLRAIQDGTFTCIKDYSF